MLIKELVAVLGIDTADFDRGAQRFLQKTRKITAAWAQAGRDISRAATRISAAMGAIGAVVTKTGLSFAAMQEQAQISFEVMLRDAAKAKRLMGDLSQFAATTPFELGGILGATKSLFGFGFTLDEIMPTLKMIGDVAAGTGKDFRELAVIFGQIRGMGRLQGQDFLQLVNAGFPVIEIARTMGTDMAGLKKHMEQGNVSFAVVEATFKRLTTEGGVFNNMMQRQSQTVAGLVSTLKDNFRQISAKIVQPLFEEIARVLPEILASLERPEFEAFIQRAQQSVRNLIQAGRELAPVLLQAAQTAWKFLQPITQFLQDHPKLMGALLALKVGGFLGLNDAILSTAKAAGQLIPVLWSLFTAMASNPLGAIAIAIGAVVTALTLFFTKTEVGKKIFADLMQTLQPFWDLLKSLWSIFGSLARILATALRPVLKLVGKLFEALWKVLKPIAESQLKLLAKGLMLVITPLAKIAGWLDKIITKAERAINKLMGVQNADPNFKPFKGPGEKHSQFSTLLHDAQVRKAIPRAQAAELVKLFKVNQDAAIDALIKAVGGNLSKLVTGMSVKRRGLLLQNPAVKAAFDAQQLNRGGGAGAGAGAGGFPAFKAPEKPVANPRDAINKALRGAQVSALDRQTPGFSSIRRFIGLPGVSGADVGRFVGSQRGISPAQGAEAGRAFAGIKARLGGNPTAQQLDKIALSLAQTINNIRNHAEQAKQATERLNQARASAAPEIANMSQRFAELKDKLPANALAGLQQRLTDWGTAVNTGRVSLGQFNAGMRQLALDTNKAVAAAEKKAAQERRAALLRGDFKGAGLDFRKALQDRIAQFRMGQFNKQVENAFNNMFGLNKAVQPVTEGLQDMRRGMTNFVESLPSPRRASAEQVAQLNQQVGAAFNSLAGRLSILRNEISLQAQKIPLLDTFRQKREAVRVIERLQRQAHDLIRASMSAQPAFTGMSIGNQNLVDPGLQKEPSNNTVNFNLPNISKFSNTDMREVMSMMERELARRGHSVVQ